MRALCRTHLRMRGEHGLDDLELAQHRRNEEVEAGAVGEQELRDVTPSHVACRAERGFPVAVAPVPGGIGERRIPVEGGRTYSRSPCAFATMALTSSGVLDTPCIMRVMGSGFVGVLTCELHFPSAHSLKEKRHYLRSAKAQLQQRVGASVAEVDHHEVWQRTRLTVACVAREHRDVERLLDEAERWLRGQEWEVALAERFVVDPED